MRGCGRRVRVPRWVFTRRRQATRTRQTVGHATARAAPRPAAHFLAESFFCVRVPARRWRELRPSMSPFGGRQGYADSTCTGTGARCPLLSPDASRAGLLRRMSPSAAVGRLLSPGGLVLWGSVSGKGGRAGAEGEDTGTARKREKNTYSWTYRYSLLDILGLVLGAAYTACRR